MNKWIKVLFVVFGFVITSILIFVILKICGIANIHTIKQLILNSGQFGLIVYFALLTIILIAFCFIPLLNTALVVLGLVLFGPLQTFICCLLANFVSSTILFYLGDKFGEKIASKLISRQELDNIQNIIDTKSKFLLPILFILPGIPDEGLCIVAGMTKIKYWYLILISLVYHALEIGLFCFFGSDLINWGSLTVLDWFLLANIIAIDIYFLFRLEKRFKK